MLVEKELKVNNISKILDNDQEEYILLSTKDLTNEEIDKLSSSKIMIKDIKMREN